MLSFQVCAAQVFELLCRKFDFDLFSLTENCKSALSEKNGQNRPSCHHLPPLCMSSPLVSPICVLVDYVVLTCNFQIPEKKIPQKLLKSNYPHKC